jgi:hypothetical protein
MKTIAYGRKLRNLVTPNFFTKRAESLELRDFSGGYVTVQDDSVIAENQISGGQNVLIDPGNVYERDGIERYGSFIGSTTGILGAFNFVNKDGVQEVLAVYDTDVYRYVTGTMTALGATLTTGNKADGAYYAAQDKFYITNGVDVVLAYTSDGTISTDSNLKKCKFIEDFESRLLQANVPSDDQENYVWFTDPGVTTTGANNYFTVREAITGLKTFEGLILIFMKHGLARVENIIWEDAINNSRPESVVYLPTDFGAIYDRTIVKAGNLVYFLGQDQDNVAHIYVTNGGAAEPITDPIAPDLNNLSALQLSSACAGFDGRYYRISVAESAQTTNNVEFIFDTIRKRFLPPNRRIDAGLADYSCYFSSESAGKWDLYAGEQSTGQLYKLNQNDYDDLPEERYIEAGTYDSPIDANAAVRTSQKFKFSDYATGISVGITGVSVLLKKNTGTTTGLTVRIETDNNGVPSGTLAHANATGTITAFTSTSYVWKTVNFTGASVAGSTHYHLVVKHTTEGTGDSRYYWRGDNTSPTYANGNRASYASGAWTADTGTDQNFVIFSKAPIDSYFDSKLNIPAGISNRYKVHKFMTMFKTVGSYYMELGLNDGISNTYDTNLIDLSGEGNTAWGEVGSQWGVSGPWGGASGKNYTWKSVVATAGRGIKFRVRNRQVSQPWSFGGIKFTYTTKRRQE